MAVAVAPAGERLAESLRTRISDVAPDHAQTVIDSLVEAIKTTKRVKGRCEKCEDWVFVNVQDSVAATNAIKLLIEQTEGRPGVADQEQAEALAVERTVIITIDAAHALELLAAGQLDQLQAELESSLPLA